MIRDAIESMFAPILNQMSSRQINTDSGNIFIGIALFYIGRAIFELSDTIKSKKFG